MEQEMGTRRQSRVSHDVVGRRTSNGATRVTFACITSCGACRFCRAARYGQCLGGGGWIPGHRIHGTRPSTYVRAPFADISTYQVPAGAADEQSLMLADILPTGYEVGVLNGTVQPGDVVAVVGAGPIGLAAIMGARLFSPSHIVAIDQQAVRLARPGGHIANIGVHGEPVTLHLEELWIRDVTIRRAWLIRTPRRRCSGW
jgi:alcohol dehydrogenase